MLHWQPSSGSVIKMRTLSGHSPPWSLARLPGGGGTQHKDQSLGAILGCGFTTCELADLGQLQNLFNFSFLIYKDKWEIKTTLEDYCGD